MRAHPEIKAQSDIGKEVKKISEEGNLVPDDIVTALAKAQLEKAKSGYVLRTKCSPCIGAHNEAVQNIWSKYLAVLSRWSHYGVNY